MRRAARSGYTLIEVIVATMILMVGVLALLGSSQIATASLRRATLELRAAELIHEGVELLSTLPLDSLADGSAVYPMGATSWLVTDSGSYRRVELSVVTRPEVGMSLADTVFLYRPR